MEALKAALKSFFSGYVSHQEHSGAGAGKPDVTTDQLAELIVNARPSPSPGLIFDATEKEVPGKAPTKKEKAAAAREAAKEPPVE